MLMPMMLKQMKACNNQHALLQNSSIVFIDEGGDEDVYSPTGAATTSILLGTVVARSAVLSLDTKIRNRLS